MLLYIPVTRADYHLAAPLFKLIRQLGGLGRHTLVLCIAKDGSVPAVEEDIINREASALGSGVFIIPMTRFPEFGWPRSCNLVFQEAVSYAKTNRAHGHLCWYFFELDNVPLHPGWIDTLQAAWEAGGKPCMGVVHPTIRGAGRRAGEHMVGTGIYPVDFSDKASACRHLHILPDPFDVSLQHQVVPMTQHTTLIQHNWSTGNYRGGSNRNTFICDKVGLRTPVLTYHNPVSMIPGKGPVVVHGCKDLSLIQLVSAHHKTK